MTKQLPGPEIEGIMVESRAKKDREVNDTSEAVEPDLYSTFTIWEKRWIIFMVTWAAFISPTSMSIYFPALNIIGDDLQVSTPLMNLTITSYMIFQGLAPVIWGNVADVAGRRPAYIMGFLIYLAANIGLALQRSYPALFLLRCLQSSGSSGAIALGMGVAADISTSSERGASIGFISTGTLLGPTIAPIIGGILSNYLDWPSIFWFLIIFAGVWLCFYAVTVPETGRNVVGNGSIAPQGWNMTAIQFLKQKVAAKRLKDPSTTEYATESKQTRKKRWPNPLKTFLIIAEKDVAVVLIYNALIYTVFYDITASMPSLLDDIYHLDSLQIGLCYLPFGVGACLATWLNGKLLDWNYRRVARSIGFTINRDRGDDLRTFPIERARIHIIWVMLVIGLAATFAYGWMLQIEANLAVPLVLQFIVGFCLNGAFNVLSVLLVDLYPASPATATAANNFVRCLVGAGGTGIIEIMIKNMGRGWCFTFLAAVSTVGMGMLWIELRYGPGWREARAVRAENQKQ